MAGKYDEVVKTLRDLPAEDDEDPRYQEKVNAVKDELSCTSDSITILFAALTDMKADLDGLLAAVVTEHRTEEYTPEALAKLYTLARRSKDEAKAILSFVQLRVTALEQLLVTSQKEDERGWGEYGATEKTVRMQSGGSVRVEYEPAGKVVDRERFQQWCLDNALVNRMYLNPQTMNAILKERLLAGMPEMDGVEAFSRAKVKLIKA